MTTSSSSTSGIPVGVFLGHVHLKVSNLDRAVWFYHDVMGFELLYNVGTAAFLAANGYHHHIGLNTWESAGGQPPAPGTTGLYHFAINYPTRRELAAALVRILDHGWNIDGASDHTTHEAIYLHDVDGNGIELAVDRDPATWACVTTAIRERGVEAIREVNSPLDFPSLLSELGGDAVAATLPRLGIAH